MGKKDKVQAALAMVNSIAIHLSSKVKLRAKITGLLYRTKLCHRNNGREIHSTANQATTRRQARGRQEQQQQQQPFQPAPPPLIQQPQQPPPPAQQQKTIDYESLRVAMPTPQAPMPAPARRDPYPLQQPESQPSPASRRDIPDLDSLRIDTPASRPSRSARTNRQQTTRTTATTTESYEGQSDGGETRRQAEAEGPAAVEQCERRVMQLLAFSGVCPAGFNWFNMRGGYICKGGNHWMSHQAIDDYFRGRDRTPRMELVSTAGFWGGHGAYASPVHPPEGLGPAGAYLSHWNQMQFLAAQGGFARIVRSSSRRHRREAEGVGEKPCECVRSLGMRVYESPEANSQDLSRVRNPTYASSGHFQRSLVSGLFNTIRRLEGGIATSHELLGEFCRECMALSFPVVLAEKGTRAPFSLSQLFCLSFCKFTKHSENLHQTRK
ncbi:hypothetical protein KC336_g2 [Hortaea werneckii]|nr:hypothetical protein KC336_g2 [Hortaea werneckii]